MSKKSNGGRGLAGKRAPRGVRLVVSNPARPMMKAGFEPKENEALDSAGGASGGPELTLPWIKPRAWDRSGGEAIHADLWEAGGAVVAPGDAANDELMEDPPGRA